MLLMMTVDRRGENSRGMLAFAGAHKVGRGYEAPYTNNFFLMISNSVWA